MPTYELSGLDAAVQGRIVTVALGACQPVFGSSLPFVVLAAVVALLLGLWLRHADAPEAKDAVVLVFFLYVVGLIPVVGLWPIGPAIAIAITAVISARAGRLRRWRDWLHVGRLDGITWVTVAAVAGVSCRGYLGQWALLK
jgi:hypothetical protein